MNDQPIEQSLARFLPDCARPEDRANGLLKRRLPLEEVFQLLALGARDGLPRSGLQRQHVVPVMDRPIEAFQHRGDSITPRSDIAHDLRQRVRELPDQFVKDRLRLPQPLAIDDDPLTKAPAHKGPRPPLNALACLSHRPAVEPLQMPLQIHPCPSQPGTPQLISLPLGPHRSRPFPKKLPLAWRADGLRRFAFFQTPPGHRRC